MFLTLSLFLFSYELGLWCRWSSSKNSGWRSGGRKKHSLFETFWHYTRFECRRRSLAWTLRQSDARILRRIRNYLFGFTPMGLYQCEHPTIFGLCCGIHQGGYHLLDLITYNGALKSHDLLKIQGLLLVEILFVKKKILYKIYSQRKVAEFFKTSTISSMFLKTFWNFLWWKIWKWGSFFTR